MSSWSRNVTVGLRMSSLGLWAITTAAALTVAIALLSAITSSSVSYWLVYRDPIDTALLDLTRGAMYGCLAAAGVGLVLGAFGRYCCLRIETSDGTATARVKLATVLEVSSLLSGAALIGVTWLGVKLIGPLPPLVEVTWALFTGIAAYIARVQFHLFLRTLAGHVAPAQVAEVKAVSRLYLYVPGGYILALGVLAAGGHLNSSGDLPIFEAGGRMLAWLIATAASVFGLFMVWRWSGLLLELRKAMERAQTDEPIASAEDDPDREYRARYLARTPAPLGSLEPTDRP